MGNPGHGNDKRSSVVLYCLIKSIRRGLHYINALSPSLASDCDTTCGTNLFRRTIFGRNFANYADEWVILTSVLQMQMIFIYTFTRSCS